MKELTKEQQQFWNNLSKPPCARACATCRTHQWRIECVEPGICWRKYGTPEFAEKANTGATITDNWEWDGTTYATHGRWWEYDKESD